MDSITIHGLPRVFSSRNVLHKAVWTVVFLAACAGLTVFLVERVKKFSARSVRIETTRQAVNNLPLPSLTICDHDHANDFSSPSSSLQFKDFPVNCTQQYDQNSSNLFRRGCQLFLPTVPFSCVYDMSSDCHFPRRFSPARNWNKCFTFNSNGSVVQSFNEKFNGVDMLLFKNSSEVTPEDYGLHRLRMYNQGLKLYVHSANEIIGLSQDGGIFLTPGERIDVAIKQRTVKRERAPFPSKCSNKSSIKQVIGGPYTQKNCQSSCLLFQIYDRCGSVLEKGRPFMPINEYPNTDKYISKTQFDSCVQNVYRSMNFPSCDCPIPCTQVYYNTEVSRRPWRNSFIGGEVRGGLTNFFNISWEEVNIDFLKKNLIHVSVFHSDFMNVTIEEKELYNLESLFCDVGGLMGLLIGASVISLFEIIWTLVHGFIKRHKSRTLNVEEGSTELK